MKLIWNWQTEYLEWCNIETGILILIDVGGKPRREGEFRAKIPFRLVS
jgi:hypothetical protein